MKPNLQKLEGWAFIMLNSTVVCWFTRVTDRRMGDST